MSKGESSLLGMMKEWLRLRGLYFVESARVRGRSGSVHTLDLAVFTDKGLVPAVLVGERLRKADIARLSKLRADIASHSVAALVETASAEELFHASSSRVEVFTREGLSLLITLARGGLDPVFLVPNPLLLSEAGRLLRDRCGGRLRILIRRGAVEEGPCIYVPIYVYKGIREGGSQASFAASAVTGSLLYSRGGSLGEALRAASTLPEELKHIYSRLRGRRIEKRDFVRLWGRKAWSDFTSAALKVGIARLEGSTLTVVDEVPSSEELEAAVDSLIAPATRSPAEECKIAEPLVSPGKTASEIYRLSGLHPYSYSLLMAPIKLGRVEGELCAVTLWGSEPLTYKPAPRELLEYWG